MIKAWVVVVVVVVVIFNGKKLLFKFRYMYI
jgi:hypothetical protein